MHSLLFYVAVFVAACIGAAARINKILPLAHLAIILLLFSLFRGGYDYQGYLDIFDDPALYAEIGYVYLVEVIKYLGGSHNTIQLLTGTLVAITLYRFHASGRYFCLAIACYMVFPMPSDIVQIRSTLSMFFIINALPFIVERKLIFASIFMLIGCSMHYFGIVFVAVVLMGYFFNQAKPTRKIKITMAIGLGAMIFTPLVVNYLLSTGFARTLSAYQAETGKISSILMWGSIICLDVAILGLFVKKYFQNKNQENFSMINLLYGAIIFSLSFLPGVYYIFEFNRLYRSIFIVKYLLASYISTGLSKNDRIALWLYVGSMAGLVGLYYHLQLDYDSILFNWD